MWDQTQEPEFSEVDILILSGGEEQRAAWVPERKLIYAVLEQVVLQYQRYAFAKDSRGLRLFQEACEYFDTQDARDTEEPFSFEHICAYLHLDPGYLRLGLKRWKAHHTTPRIAHRMRMPPHPRIALSA